MILIKEENMKKLVLKTAGITLATIIILLAITYGVLALAFPGTLGDFFYDTGSYTVGIKYYEREYEKSEDLEDLYNLCVKLNVKEDASKTSTYTKKLMDNENFDTFCQKKDGEVSSVITTREYIEGKYLCAVYKLKVMSEVITEGKNVIEASGYTKHSCFSTLISTYGSSFTKTDIELLTTALSPYISSTTLSVEEKLNVVVDLEALSVLNAQ